MLPQEGLKQYYETTFALLYHHKLDPRIFDEMIPWERDVYLGMMVKEIENENLKKQLAAQEAKARGQPTRGRRR